MAPLNTIIEGIKLPSLADRALIFGYSSQLPKATKKNSNETEGIINKYGCDAGATIVTDKLWGSELKPLTDVVWRLRTQLTDGLAPYHSAGVKVKGQWLMPCTMYADMTALVQQLRGDLEQATKAIVADYPNVLARRMTALQGLFDISNYPTAEEFASHVKLEVRISPVPSSGSLQHLMGIVAEAQREELVAQLEQVETQQHRAWAQSLAECVRNIKTELNDRIAKVLSAENPRIFDTLYDQIRVLIKTVDGLNLTEDQVIKDLVKSVNEEILSVRPDDLRGDKPLQEKIKEVAKEASAKADEMAKKLDAFDMLF